MTVPDPRGPKTYGSGSTTLLLTERKGSRMRFWNQVEGEGVEGEGLENENIPSKSNKQKNFKQKVSFLLASC
jgi:hypothetical protein